MDERGSCGLAHEGRRRLSFAMVAIDFDREIN